MKPMTAEWVAKAEGDFATVERESRARKSPNYDALCFHAQQCVEKYLKALLHEIGMSFPKIHDLAALLELLLPSLPEFEEHLGDLGYLTDFAVAFRYPGESADKASAKEAQTRCRRFRKVARKELNLEV